MKYFRNIICIILVITLGIFTPINVHAASPKYISDVMVYEADSFEEAETGLAGLGYEIVADSNLNATLSTGVYLGYKTTDDPNEAITDIAAMNMTGNFSYSDYKELMKKYRNQVENTIRGFEMALAEFQTNFANGKPEAQMAYDSINLYRDDDSGKLMGDYLLDYDFSPAAQTQLTDTIMQANSDIIMSIMQNVCMASDTEETSLPERLAESDPDSLLDRYLGVYLTPAKAQRAIEKDLGATANVLRVWWDTFYQYLLTVEADDFVTSGSGYLIPKTDLFSISCSAHPEEISGLNEDMQEYLIGLTDVTTDLLREKVMQDVTLFLMLTVIPYGDGTLLDFFKRPLAEVSQNELYAVAEAMSEGQRGQLEVLGLRAILLGACIELDETVSDTQETVESNAEDKAEMEPISIFQDVDRSIFEDGVALTGSAVQHEQQTGESWLTKLAGVDFLHDSMGIGLLVSSAVGLGTLTAGVVAAMYQGKLVDRAIQSANTAPELLAKQKALQDQFTIAKGEFEIETRTAKKHITDQLNMALESGQNYTKELEASISELPNRVVRQAKDAMDKAEAELNAATSAVTSAENAGTAERSAIRTAKIAKCVSFALFVITLIADIYFIYEICSRIDPTEEAVPHHLLAAIDTAYGEDYVYYASVKDQNGEPADVNNHEGDKSIGWLVLYQTREMSAGAPLLAEDLRVQTGSNSVDEDGAFVHLFDQLGALNLTDPRFTGANDSVNGTYVLFSRDANAFAGSAISGGIAALCAVGGLIVGLTGGILLGGHKKKKELPAET